MSYKPGTILARKEPVPASDPEAAQYNVIRVVGPSPVQSGVRSEEFAGQAGDELTITPHLDFGPNVDQPEGALQRDYNVVSEPPPVVMERGEVTVLEPGDTPEQVFAREAREQAARDAAAAEAAKTDSVVVRNENLDAKAKEVAASAEEIAARPPLTAEEEIERAAQARAKASDVLPEEALAAAQEQAGEPPARGAEEQVAPEATA